MFGLGVNRLGVTNQATIFTPASLFNNGEAGVWYDPSAASGSLDWQRNLLEYTESFDNSYWIKENTSISSNQAVAPDGTNTADKVEEQNTNNTFHFVTRAISLGAGVKTFSAYVKADERSFAGLTLRVNDGSVRIAVLFNLTSETVSATITVGSPSQTSSSIQDVGNGWYRCSVSAYHSSGNVFALLSPHDVGTSGNINMNYAGTVGYGIYAWGEQLEEASTASSYQPILSTFENAFKAAFPSHTLYQDYLGATPVTAVGQPVGLMLDKSEGLKQGPELVTNGDFVSDTGWTLASGFSISNGLLVASNAGNYAINQYPVSGLVADKFYAIEFVISEVTSGTIRCGFLGGTTLLATVNLNQAGVYTVIVKALAGNNIVFIGTAGAGFTGSIDNISVKEIQGSHATQPTSTKRPIYARHPEGGIRNLLNYTEQLDNGAWSKISTGGAAVSVIPSSYAAPDGTYSATQVLGLDTLNSRLDQTTALPALADKTYTYSVWLRGSGVIGINASSTTGVGGGAEIGVTLTSTWTRHDVTNTFNSSPTGNVRVHGVITRATGTAPEVHMWSPQLEEATEASNYQKRVTDIDVTESGVGEVYYLKFDGVDDGMAINNLTSASTPLTALFGYSSTNANAASGKYLINIQYVKVVFAASADVAGQIGYFDDDWSSFAADSNAIKVLTYDLVEDNAKIRVDGTQEYSDTTYNQQAISGDVGLFTKHNRANNFLAGNMYQTILRAAESTDEEIAKAETFVANKTGLKAQVDGIATLDLNFGNNTYTAKNSNGGVI